jgi:cysteine synthase
MNPLPAHRYLHRMAPTPLVPLAMWEGAPTIWCKLEFMNPSGSTKDRIARYILEKAWRAGAVRPGSVVVEASSGSTSIALALCCAQMGMKFIAFIPDTATNERSLMIQAYGGEVRKVTGGMPEVIRAAHDFSQRSGAFLTRQFENEDNSEAHELGTAHEILSQLPQPRIDAVVSGIGTGGSLVGLHRGFTHAGCRVTPVAAIPCAGSDAFASNIECCSLRFSRDVPGVIDGCSQLFARWKNTEDARHLIELRVSDERCMELTRELWQRGFPVGPSSGLNLGAALHYAAQAEADAVIVTVFPDRMERYFSHKVFEPIA